MHGVSAQLGAAMGLSNAHSHLPPAPRAGAEQGQPPDTCPALGLGEAWLGADEWVALELYEAHSNLLSCQCKQKTMSGKDLVPSAIPVRADSSSTCVEGLLLFFYLAIKVSCKGAEMRNSNGRKQRGAAGTVG